MKSVWEFKFLLTVFKFNQYQAIHYRYNFALTKYLVADQRSGMNATKIN